MFANLGSAWRRSISGIPEGGPFGFGGFGPRIELFHRGNDPATSIVDTVIASGAFQPEITPQSSVCFCRDIPF